MVESAGSRMVAEDGTEMMDLEGAGASQSARQNKGLASRVTSVVSSSVGQVSNLAKTLRANIRKQESRNRFIGYVLFMAVFSVITFLPSSGEYSYEFTRGIAESVGISGKDAANMPAGTTPTDFWHWTVNQMIPVVLSKYLYTGSPPYADGMSSAQKFAVDQQFYHELPANEAGRLFLRGTYRVGKVRLTQKRVREGAGCTIAGEVSSFVTTCYGTYDDTREETKDIIDAGAALQDGFTAENNPFRYRPHGELSSLPIRSVYWGRLGFYGSGGYALDLDNDAATARDQVYKLMKNKWIDESTRAVFIDLAVFNPSLNAWGVVRLSFEFPPNGFFVPTTTIRNLSVFRYFSTESKVLLGFEILFLLLLLYMFISEIFDWRSQGTKKYWSSLWNIFDWVNMLLLFGDVAVRVVFQVYLPTIDFSSTSAADLEIFSYWYQQEVNVYAFNIFLVYFKAFKYLAKLPRFYDIFRTLGRAGIDLILLLLVFVVIFFGFAAAHNFAFGSYVSYYRTVGTSMMTLVRMLLGDFDYATQAETNRVLGPLLFVCFIFLGWYVLLNMFLAIITDAYSDVKDDAEQNPHVLHAFKEKIKRTVNKALRSFGLRKSDLLPTEPEYKLSEFDPRAIAAREGLADVFEQYPAARILLETMTTEEIRRSYDLDDDGVLSESELRMLLKDLVKRERERTEREAEAYALAAARLGLRGSSQSLIASPSLTSRTREGGTNPLDSPSGALSPAVEATSPQPGVAPGMYAPTQLPDDVLRFLADQKMHMGHVQAQLDSIMVLLEGRRAMSTQTIDNEIDRILRR